MALASLVHWLLLLSIPWLLIDVLARFLERQRQSPLLRRADGGTGKGSPWSASLAKRIHRLTTQPSARLTGDFDARRGTSLSRTRLTINFETTAFNRVPELCLRVLGIPTSKVDDGRRGGGSERNGAAKEHRRAPLASLLQRFYHFGEIFGTFALAASYLFLVLGALKLASDLLGGPDQDDQSMTEIFDTLAKRSMEDQNAANARLPRQKSSMLPQIVPLIPGLTLPWDHVIPVGLSLVITQIIHEAGHAFCAALYGIRPIAMGATLIYPAIPVAYVALPASATGHDEEEEKAHSYDEAERGAFEQQNGNASHGFTSLPRQREIVAAGVWHNAVMAGLMFSLVLVGITGSSHAFFWRNVEGLRVTGIDVIKVGSVVTQIDDVNLRPIRDPANRTETWQKYLVDVDVGYIEANAFGWCLPGSIWDNATTTCCNHFSSTERLVELEPKENSVCFLEAPHSLGRCPDPMLMVEGNYSRCTGECVDGSPCVRPDPREELVRISTISEGGQRVILFQGLGSAISQALRLSGQDFAVPMLWWLEPWYNLAALLWQYTLTFSVAMVLFNMLPVHGLDGDAFMSLLAASLMAHSGNSQKSSQRSRLFSRAMSSKAIAQIQRRIHWLTLSLAVFVFGGSTLYHARQA